MSAPSTPTGATRTHADTRPAVTVLSGFWPFATFAVSRALLADDPTLLLVRHDSTRVHDALATLARLARSHPRRDLVLLLPEVAEPEALATAGAHTLIDGVPVTDVVRFDSYTTVVDAEHLLDGLAATDDLADRGIAAGADDHRSIAEVICRQIEYADTVVCWGRSPDGPFGTGQLGVLLDRLAPWATHLAAGAEPTIDATALARHLRHTHRHRPDTPARVARGLAGYPLGVHEPVADCGVVSAVFRARRPFHPRRLHDALPMVTDRALRSRGNLWLASQPDTVLTWETAGGGVAMGALGRWLDALPEDRWHTADEQRRLAAAVDWDPYYGDRHHHLVFVGVDLDPVHLHRLLSTCLLTDAELSTGEEGWRALADPFAGCFPIPGPAD